MYVWVRVVSILHFTKYQNTYTDITTANGKFSATADIFSEDLNNDKLMLWVFQGEVDSLGKDLLNRCPVNLADEPDLKGLALHNSTTLSKPAAVAYCASCLEISGSKES